MTGRVDGKVAFITGAARGQGRSHAIRLATEGADVIAVDVCEEVEGTPHSGATPDDLAETVREVRALGRRIFASQVDVRNYEALKRALDQGVGELGGLDIVCANAGITTEPRPAHEVSEAEWQTTIDINLTGVWHTAKAAIPHLITGGRGGSIVLTSSAAGLRGYRNIAQYVASKHGLVGLMRTMALELAPHMIRVNSVHPGNVNTPMIMHESFYELFCPGIDDPTRDDFAASAATKNPMPIPWVEASDISNAVLFLASDEGRYITGVALPIDFGTTL